MLVFRGNILKTKQVQVKKSSRIVKKHALLCASAKSLFRRSGTVKRLCGIASGFNFPPRCVLALICPRVPLPRSRFQATIVRALWNHAILPSPETLQRRDWILARDTATFPGTGGGVRMTDSNFSPQLIGVRVQRLLHHSLANSCEGYVASLFPPETLSYSVPPSLCKYRKVRGWRAAITITVT
jgi:hypothetical protein